jgi:sugar/nucleoside kinase (ribokinase family)/phosphoglycolate phosphatase-like HAD superfamily hydrolase
MKLESLLRKLADVRIAVLGDFCLDVYWTMDQAASERSVETGLATRPVRNQRCSLGGAGNVVGNLLALGVGRVAALGVMGDDPYGHEMRRLMEAQGVDCAGILTQRVDWDTPVYIKPIRDGREENRMDFGNSNRLEDETGTALVGHLRSRMDDWDAVIVNQQLRSGLHTPHVQALLQALFSVNRQRLFVADSRHLAGSYADCILKVNDVEATSLCGGVHQPGDLVPLDEAREAAFRLFQRRGKPVFVSRGARGALAADGSGLHAVPGLHIVNKIDPVGAGDSMTAGLTAALAAGVSPLEAVTFGNYVAGVTVQKLFETGTATPAEVLAIGRAPDYVYAPELADDPRQARIAEGTEIELVEMPGPLRITHAIFDHDGTISTLRQGWEAVMQPMMVKAILGARYAAADASSYSRVVGRVREFIDKTTGIQTLVQMQGLVSLVREFGLVPAGEVLDEFRYRDLYLGALMEGVRARLCKLRRGELSVADLTVKNAPEFLQRLHAAGVRLYLASGTDEAHVVSEADALGYAPLFEGRIYGAVGDVKVEAKRMVLDRILNEIGAAGGGRVVAFGDGPVEIRETRKRGGLTVGIASDEVRRYGLNPAKRSRLIRAGAHMIIPDFSQLDAVQRLLGVDQRRA